MKFSKKATSIAEALVVTLIISSGLVGVYNIYNNSMKLSNGVKNKIAAIQIAREGIEAVNNIRDTNWLIFSKLNYEKCWNTLNYNNSCINSLNIDDYIIENNQSYKVYRNSENRWILSKATTLASNDYVNEEYRDFYEIKLDSNGLYTQSGSVGNNGVNSLKPTFTREIIVSYLDNPEINDNYQKMKVESIVRWSDNSRTNPREIHLETVLTNWKK